MAGNRSRSSWIRAVCIGFALLMLSSGAAQAQVVTEFSAGITAGAIPQGITAGPDGNLWFTEVVGNQIGRITTGASCTEDALTMCLIGGRYKVTSYWRNQYAGGATSNLNKVRLTDATGAFWLSDSNTYEYMIRFNTVTDNGRAWIAIPMFTDVEFWVAVTDTANGQYKEYHSAPGNKTLIYDPFFFVYPAPAPPIVLTGSLFADPLSGGGNLLLTDVCGCVSVPLTVVSNARPPEPLACHETHPLDYSSSTVVVTVSAPTWSVSGTYSVPLDPHVGLRVHADCRSN
jgi:hypothetical protein